MEPKSTYITKVEEGPSIQKLHFYVIWDMIHSKARDATDESSQRDFIEFMSEVCKYIPCGDCSQHCKNYLSSHPFTNYINIRDEQDGRLIGMFIWSWLFHNAVNKRLGRPQMEWQRAVNIYYSRI